MGSNAAKSAMRSTRPAAANGSMSARAQGEDHDVHGDDGVEIEVRFRPPPVRVRLHWI
jgi:hypothetical protein